MKNIIIIGAGGFGREVKWLIERINSIQNEWNILGFVDDNIEKGKVINDSEVLGNLDYLKEQNEDIYAACAIANPISRGKVIEKLRINKYVKFPNIIDPSVISSSDISFGEGNIICASTIMTVNIAIGDFNIINLDCTLGHDVTLSSFVTLYPSVNISGEVSIDDYVEIGTGVQIIQGISLNKKCVVGAGAVVVDDIIKSGTYVGVPAKSINI